MAKEPTKKRAAWGSLSKNATEIVIEKEVPIPTPGRKGAPIYPFAQMKIGDSFLLSKKLGSAAKSSAYKYAAEHLGFRFSARDLPEGVRIWRVEDNRTAPKKKKK